MVVVDRARVVVGGGVFRGRGGCAPRSRDGVRVTHLHTWRWHITTQELEQRMGLDSIDVCIARRQLRWLGHVSRMDFERLPRRMLSSWVPAPRPRGAPKMTYGRTICKALDHFSIAHATWPQLAADRLAWRQN